MPLQHCQTHQCDRPHEAVCQACKCDPGVDAERSSAALVPTATVLPQMLSTSHS